MRKLLIECYDQYPKAFKEVIDYFGKDRFIIIDNMKNHLHKALVDDYELLNFFDNYGIVIYIGEGSEELFKCTIKELVCFHKEGGSLSKVYDLGEFVRRESALVAGLSEAFEILEGKCEDTSDSSR